MHSLTELDVLETERREVPARVPGQAAANAAVSRSMELKLARAHAVFAHLAPDDPRARLLQVAVLRRDEILLEAMLRRLDSPPPL